MVTLEIDGKAVAVTNADEGADGDPGAQAGVGSHRRHRMHSGRRTRLRRKQTDGAGERQIRVRRPQRRGMRHSRTVAQDHGRRPGHRQQLFVFRVREKCDVAGSGVLQSGNAEDIDVAVTFEPALEVRGKVA